MSVPSSFRGRIEPRLCNFAVPHGARFRDGQPTGVLTIVASMWRPALTDPDVFRERASRCRELLKVAVVPEIVDQLKVWAREFDEEADRIDLQLAAARKALRESMRRRA
jgi:hypothetical protein